jgi:hypothetical protein
MRNGQGVTARNDRRLRASGRTSRKSRSSKLAKRTHPPRWQEKVVRKHRENEAICQIVSTPAGNQFGQTNPHAKLAHVSTENACKTNPPAESSATPHEKHAERTQYDG